MALDAVCFKNCILLFLFVVAPILGPVKQKKRKIAIVLVPISLNMCFGAQKKGLI